MDLNSYLFEEDFEEFCRMATMRESKLHVNFLGIINDEDYQGFKERCYTQLETDYINSIDKTIH